LFNAHLVPVEMLFGPRGTPSGGSTPSRATLVGAIEKSLNVDFGKLSQNEWVHGLPPSGLNCRGSIHLALLCIQAFRVRKRAVLRPRPVLRLT
jgi:hypothetical protein